MSDEENHEHHDHNHGFAFHVPSPEEIREHMEHQRAVQEMNAHETRQFFDSLTEDQMTKLIGLFHQVIGTDGHAGSYYIGVMNGFLDLKFHKCMACTKDHDKELAKVAGDGGPSEAQSERAEQIMGSGQSVPEPGFPSKGSTSYEAIMVEYNMEEDDEGSDHVMCKGCQTWYENLQDRVRRVPGPAGCDGCIQKQKWG